MLRVSSYLSGTPLNDNQHFLLLHGFSGAVDKVGYNLGKTLVDHRGQRFDVVSQDMGDDIDPSITERLIKRGYLTLLSWEDEKNLLLSIATELHENDLKSSPVGFMIVPTYMCNLRCPYCFQDHKMHAGKGKFETIISKDQVSACFNILDKLATDNPVNGEDETANKIQRTRYPQSLTLFGGEPLFAKTVDIVPHIIDECRKRGMKLSAITNGVELDLFSEYLTPEIIDNLQITIDGKEELHDSRRIGPVFRKTFQKISDNIDLALLRGVNVSVRMNIDSQNIDDLKVLAEYFTSKNWTSNEHFYSYASAVHSVDKYKYHVSCDDVVTETIYLKETQNSSIESYENYARDFLKNALFSDKYPFKTGVNCAAETGLLIFDPLGNVYTCWEDVGYEHLKIGTYGSEGLSLFEEISKQWLLRFPGSIHECSECPYALIHKSGCASHARKETGTIYHNACESFKEFFPKTLAYEYEKIEAELFK